MKAVSMMQSLDARFRQGIAGVWIGKWSGTCWCHL